MSELYMKFYKNTFTVIILTMIMMIPRLRALTAHLLYMFMGLEQTIPMTKRRINMHMDTGISIHI